MTPGKRGHDPIILGNDQPFFKGHGESRKKYVCLKPCEYLSCQARFSLCRCRWGERELGIGVLTHGSGWITFTVLGKLFGVLLCVLLFCSYFAGGLLGVFWFFGSVHILQGGLLGVFGFLVLFIFC